MGRTTAPYAYVIYRLRTKTGFVRFVERAAVPALRDIGRTVERTMYTRRAIACTWCKARPSVWETDCDGTYNTHRCNAPQCMRANEAWICGEGPKPNHYWASY